MYGVERCKYYVRGKPFILETDHANLLYLERSEVPILIRWRAFLQSFVFVIRHIPGKLNVVADWLSQMHEADDYSPDPDRPSRDPHTLLAQAVSMDPASRKCLICCATRRRLTPSRSCLSAPRYKKSNPPYRRLLLTLRLLNRNHWQHSNLFAQRQSLFLPKFTVDVPLTTVHARHGNASTTASPDTAFRTASSKILSQLAQSARRYALA